MTLTYVSLQLTGAETRHCGFVPIQSATGDYLQKMDLLMNLLLLQMDIYLSHQYRSQSYIYVGSSQQLSAMILLSRSRGENAIHCKDPIVLMMGKGIYKLILFITYPCLNLELTNQKANLQRSLKTGFRGIRTYPSLLGSYEGGKSCPSEIKSERGHVDLNSPMLEKQGFVR